MSMVLNKDALSQGFAEQISNMIIAADREIFDLAMIDMLEKIMIAHIDVLCARAELGKLLKFENTCIILKHITEHIRCITDNLEVIIPDLCY